MMIISRDNWEGLIITNYLQGSGGDFFVSLLKDALHYKENVYYDSRNKSKTNTDGLLHILRRHNNNASPFKVQNIIQRKFNLGNKQELLNISIKCVEIFLKYNQPVDKLFTKQTLNDVKNIFKSKNNKSFSVSKFLFANAHIYDQQILNYYTNAKQIKLLVDKSLLWKYHALFCIKNRKTSEYQHIFNNTFFTLDYPRSKNVFCIDIEKFLLGHIDITEDLCEYLDIPYMLEFDRNKIKKYNENNENLLNKIGLNSLEKNLTFNDYGPFLHELYNA